MNKSAMIAIFVILLALPIATAAPPFQSASKQSYCTWDIVYPKLDIFKAGNDIQLNFHMFNCTGVPLRFNFSDRSVASPTCFFHLYYPNGSHRSELIPVEDDNLIDFHASIGAAKVEDSGRYPYIIQCNFTNEGGFSSLYFDVSAQGVERGNPETPWILAINVLIPLLLLFGLLYLSNTMDERHAILKMSFFVFAFLIYGYIAWVGWAYVSEFMVYPPMETMSLMFFRIVTMFVGYIWIYIGFYFGKEVVENIQRTKLRESGMGGYE